MTQRRDIPSPVFSPGKVLGWSCVIGLVALVPFIYQDQYGLGVMTTMFTIMTLNVSWNFLLGFGGVWNFGQLAVFAVGGYGAGISILNLGIPPFLAIPVGGVVGAILALVIAIPTLRLFGIYTALLTFSAAQIVQLLVRNDSSGLTGGPLGLPGVPGLFTSLSPLGSSSGYFWLGLAVATATVVISAIAIRSPFGLALRTTKDSLAYASSRGIDVRRYRILAFVAAGFFAGVAGSLYTLYNGSMTPTVMGLTPMSIYVAMLVIGGLGSVTGPIIGTAVVTFIQQALLQHPGLQLTVLGVILLIVVIFLPRGIGPGISSLWDRVLAWADEESGTEASGGDT